MIKTIGLIGYQFLPERIKAAIRKFVRRRDRARMKSLSALTVEMFRNILTNDLKLKRGDVVCIHSAMSGLKPGFGPNRVLEIIREIIGEEGTMLAPTYPRLASYEFLLSGEVFDVRNSPSYTGAISEALRTQKGAIRSLHPTKSVCAVGPLAKVLTETHQNSPYPYDDCSPYYKLVPHHGVIIGLGVSTHNLAFVQTVDDALRKQFPVEPYKKRCFEAKCINYGGQVEVVKTYGHNMLRMNHNMRRYMAKYISPEACQDMTIQSRHFFRADAQLLFKEMVALAKKNITMYPRISYKWNKIL